METLTETTTTTAQHETANAVYDVEYIRANGKTIAITTKVRRKIAATKDVEASVEAIEYGRLDARYGQINIANFPECEEFATYVSDFMAIISLIKASDAAVTE